MGTRMNSKWIQTTRWSRITVACVLLGIGMGVAWPSAEAAAPGVRQTADAQAGGIPLDLGLSFDRRMADLSLAVREQVDFLLTPALLVQEAVCEDVVLTYPEE